MMVQNQIKGLRFAPLIRVSTEKQEKKGESLKLQRQQIERDVKLLGGVIPKHCWRYSGQEHATPEQERKKLDQLLDDSSKDLFDAIIVVDISRWSRDNHKHERGIQILKENGIKFFSGIMEYNLFDPQAEYFLTTSVASGRLQTKENIKKSLTNRIERLKQNIPATGLLPFGRSFDKETKTWGIIPEKKKQIEKAAKLFLGGMSMEKVSDRVGLRPSHLYDLFRNRCGDTITGRITAKWFPHINYQYDLKVPELLPEETIKALHRRCAEKGAPWRNKHKHRHLLSHFIFCAECKKTLAGHGSEDGRYHYYRHLKTWDGEEIECSFKFKSINADLIENAVMKALLDTLDDEIGLEEAMKREAPTLKDAAKMEKEVASLENKLKGITAKKNKLLNAIEEGALEMADIKNRMDEHKAQEQRIQEEIEDLKSKLKTVISKKQIKRRSKIIASWNWSYDMTFTQQRKYLKLLFPGKDEDGNRHGIYLDKKKGKWYFQIIGAFPQVTGVIDNPGDNGYKVIIECDHLPGIDGTTR